MEYEKNSISDNAQNLMVFLHGLGSNGDDLFSLVPYLAPKLPDTYFYSPDGIEPCDIGPYGFQWFSLEDRSPTKLTLELQRVTPAISKMIKDKATSLGLSLKDVILFGFSQGTMVSLSLALTSDEPYKAVIGFSGRLFMPSVVTNTKTPICLVHGAEDDVVPIESLKHAKEALEKLGINIMDLTVPNLVHSIDMTGLEFAIKFLKENSSV